MTQLGLDVEQWQTPSLCDGWRVRDVAVHLTHAQLGAADMLRAAVRAGFRFDPMVRDMALRDKATPTEISARLRADAASRRRPPMTAEADPLTDVLVHTQDICVPLRIVRPTPIDAAVVAARRLWDMKFPLHPRRALPGIRLVADDAEFDVGAGRRLDAPIRDIMMLLAGRTTAVREELRRAVAAPASGSA